MRKSEMGILQSNIHSIMYQNSMPDIKRFSRYFVDNIALLYKMRKPEKGHNQPNIYRIFLIWGGFHERF